MPFIPDGAPYDFLAETIPFGVTAVAIGWLGAGEPFPRGPVSHDVLDHLRLAIRTQQWAVTRGFHRCPFCAEPQNAEHSGVEGPRGNAEVRFASSDARTWFIAPTLVAHYIDAHDYEPPADFLEAVAANRVVLPD
jgi:hypothetical protein